MRFNAMVTLHIPRNHRNRLSLRMYVLAATSLLVLAMAALVVVFAFKVQVLECSC